MIDSIHGTVVPAGAILVTRHNTPPRIVAASAVDAVPRSIPLRTLHDSERLSRQDSGMSFSVLTVAYSIRKSRQLIDRPFSPCRRTEKPIGPESLPTTHVRPQLRPCGTIRTSHAERIGHSCQIGREPLDYKRKMQLSCHDENGIWEIKVIRPTAFRRQALGLRFLQDESPPWSLQQLEIAPWSSFCSNVAPCQTPRSVTISIASFAC